MKDFDNVMQVFYRLRKEIQEQKLLLDKTCRTCDAQTAMLCCREKPDELIKFL